MKIRKAEIRDSAGLAHVQVDSYRTAYVPIFPQSYLEHFTYEEQTQDWRDLLASEMDDVLYVAVNDAEEVVGYVLGRPVGDIPPYDAELVALHVRSTYQRQGIGTELIATIAKALMDEGCASIMLWTLEKNPVRALYERLGGQFLGEKDWGGNATFGVDVREVTYGWPIIEDLVREGNG